MIYLTSDIHGCFKEFKKMLEYLNFGPEDYLYIIGDAVDRGPEPIPLFQFIMRQPNMELLMGNHEQGFLWNVYKNDSVLSDSEIREFWLSHGGQETWIQYMKLSEPEKQEIISWLKGLPFYKIVGKNILSHARGFYRRHCVRYAGITDGAAGFTENAVGSEGILRTAVEI